MATFGYTTLGVGGWAQIDDYISGYHDAPAAGNGPVTNITSYIRNTDIINHKVKASLYTYVGPGDAGSPIANGQSNEVDLAPTAGRWVIFTFAANPIVTNGTQYFIMVWADNWGDVDVAYDGGGPAGIGLFKLVAYGAWPDPLAAETSSTAQRSIYATYTPTAAGGEGGFNSKTFLVHTL